MTKARDIADIDQELSTADSPTFAGLTTTANVSFGDADKAMFGAGNDLQIYHSVGAQGGASIIDEVGEGSLFIRGTNVVIQHRDSDPNEQMIQAIANGAVTLSHNGSPKIATTSTGVAVTGNITATGAVTAGDVNITGPSPILTLTDNDVASEYTQIQNSAGHTYIDSRNGAGDGFVVFRGLGGGVATEYARFDASGNFGLGDTSPSEALSVTGNIAATGSVTADSLVVNGNNYPSAGALSNRNMVINGAMQVAQRGTSFAGLTDGTLTYTLDRWAFSEQGASTGVFTVTQDTDTPAGFGSSLKMDCTTADATLANADSFWLQQKVEAQNLQQLDYGSAAAQEATMSFWVKSNKTGTYVVWLFLADDSRSNQVQYTIDVADTWEKKTGVISADTTGIINNDIGAGLFVRFVLGSGTNYTSGTAPTAWETNTAANRYAGQTVNLADNTANYFNVTGVQLEVGDTSTPFEHRSYAQEMALCQRYYWRDAVYLQGYQAANGDFSETVQHPVQMRASPTRGWTSNPTNITNVVAYFIADYPPASSSTNTRVYARATATGHIEFGSNYSLDAEL